jgi:hypothetical protein
MVVSLLITSAAFLPLLARSGQAAPIAQAAAIPYTAPVPQTLSLRSELQGSYRNPETCRGNCSWIHDPSIVFKDEIYWRFSTNGNIAVHTANFLEGPWLYRGALLDNGTSIHLRNDQEVWVSIVTALNSIHIALANTSLGTIYQQARRLVLLPLRSLFHGSSAFRNRRRNLTLPRDWQLDGPRRHRSAPELAIQSHRPVRLPGG